MNIMQLQVEEFHGVMEIPVGNRPGMEDDRITNLLIQEESRELQDAVDSQDFLAAIDALCDLVYVCFGAAVRWGVDLAPFFEEVHRANMRKTGSHRDEATGRISKPESWVPPNHAPILADQIENGISHRVLIYDPRPMYRLKHVGQLALCFDREELAKTVHEVWAAYAEETITELPPTFNKPWEEMGEWGKEVNRRTADALLEVFLNKLVMQGYNEVGNENPNF